MSSEIVEDIVLKVRKGFNQKRFNELFNSPPKRLTSFHDNKSTYRVDKDWFKKMMQYIYNLVFKNLDILGLYGGEEGTGKSTKASQDNNTYYYIMKECNVLNVECGTEYPFNEENCLAHNLISFLKKADKYNDYVFRLLQCDEAGGLKSEERWDEWNKKFREEMRKDRKKLRIRLLCYPQPFELVKDFTLARVNYIHLSEFREDKKLGLIPDMAKIIIIPRGKFTFSFNTHELIAKKEIKGALLEQTKERYSKELHQKYIYKTIKCDATFCFDVKKYMKNAKEENRLFLREEKVFLSANLIRIIGKNLTAGKIGLSIRIDKALMGKELKEKTQERKDALLISKLVNRCRGVSFKNNLDEITLETEE